MGGWCIFAQSLFAMEYKHHEDFLKKIRSGDIAPIVILHGDESYFVDLLTDALIDLIPEQERSFNQDILYAKDIEPRTVMDYARQFPMMAERRMVLVKEANDINAWDALMPILLNPVHHAIVVLSFKKKIDGRLKWFKDCKSSDSIDIFISEPIKESDLGSWINNYLKKRKFSIDPPANALLCQYLGSDLHNLVNELDKIILQIAPNSLITTDLIDTYVGISKEYNTFELCKALAYKEEAKAHMISYYMAQNLKSTPLQMILPGLMVYFQKVLLASRYGRLSDPELGKIIGAYGSYVIEYRLAAKHYDHAHIRRIIDWIAQADAHLKGVGSTMDDDQILTELVSKIFIPTKVFAE